MAATMKRLLVPTLFLLGAMQTGAASPVAPTHVYLVIYTTCGGETGHAGLAIDRYDILVSDCSACPGKVRYDTVKTGRLVYYDLWPVEVSYSFDSVFVDKAPRYFKLPSSSSEKPITVTSLLAKGIPHEKGYSCDGLIRIPGTPESDGRLERFMDRLITRNRMFNAVYFNCADFVKTGLEYLLNTDLPAEENIADFQITTPNRLYQVVRELPGAEVIKDAGPSAQTPFLEGRIRKQ